ncbi:MarR family transcriptional regulator [Amycolatopsis sp. CA-126428]|uniref:MarR family transcriptional regulator n=1 Tax=Amycolatopsis sp. CA-126428 TaxID=2073158 RepID=UPI001E507949|nr:MarR family transcriptional regulator [Amycolatopsis sp. CA-126428]
MRTEVVIDLSREVVAKYAIDPSHAPEWYANIESVDWETPPPLGVGSRLAFVARFPGRRLAYTYGCPGRSWLTMKTGDTEAQGAGSGDPATPPPTLLYLVKQVELSVRAGLDALVRPADITTLQYTALTVLERHPDLTAARLARHSFVTDQSMADMVTTLLNRGLIERHRDPADRRRLVIALTPAGQRLLDGLRPQVAALQDHMLSLLSDGQAGELQHSLELCRRALLERPAESAPPPRSADGKPR